MKFKVGDLVVPKTKEECLAEGYRLDWYDNFGGIPCIYTEPMFRQYGGKTLRIKSIRSSGNYNLEELNGNHIGFCWSNKMLKPANTPAGNTRLNDSL